MLFDRFILLTLPLVLALIAGRASSSPPVSPAEELAAAVSHIERLDPHRKIGVRYLSLYNLPESERARVRRVVDFVLNSTSRSRTVRHPEQVTETLLVFDIGRFTTNQDEFDAWRKGWEQLVESDAYFHLQTEILDSESGKTSVVTTDGGWVGLENATLLQGFTQSKGPLLRADMFITYALSTLDGGVYYQLAGIPPTEKEWFESLGLDLPSVLRVRAMGGANIAISGVTKKPRRIFRLQAALGGCWQTLDSAEVLAGQSPLRQPISADGQFGLEYDAGEYIAVGPNGLLRYALYDSSGKIQDSVPDNIAKDDSDSTGDGRLQPAISCIRCHAETGFRPFGDALSQLLGANVDVESHDPALIERSVEFYNQSRLARQLSFDRQTYEAALVRVTGKSPLETSADVALVFREYSYRPLRIDRAAREVGLTAEQFRVALPTTRDPILLLLMAGHPVLRQQWESSYAEAALAAAAFKASTSGP